MVATQCPVPPTGAQLYATYCSNCHNPLASSKKRKASASTIQSSINTNKGGMGTTALKALTPAQVQSIATALNF
ncbi:MAG: cytochrome c [Planctomycetota bacterium]|nr:cytochrome c [Planctomycetota bacterium]